MATTIVIPAAADIGAFSPDVADDFLREKGSYDPKLAQKVIDIATAASADINALQAGTSSTAVNGVAMPAGGALTTGAVLRVTGVATAAYGQVDLADTDAVTGVLPGANVALAVAGVSQGAVTGAQATAIDAGMTAAKKTVTMTHASLVAAAATETVNIGTALPANARIVGVDFHTYTAFSGGTISDFTVDVGTAGDVDALIDGPNKLMGAVQLIATVRCGSDDVADATAGAITVDVTYIVLA